MTLKMSIKHKNKHTFTYFFELCFSFCLFFFLRIKTLFDYYCNAICLELPKKNGFQSSVWFCLTTLCDWLIKLTPLSQPMRSKTKTSRDSLARVFPRLAPVTSCISIAFCIGYVCCDWSQ